MADVKISWFSLIPVALGLFRDIAKALKPESSGGTKVTIDEIVEIFINALTGFGLSLNLDVKGVEFVKQLLTQIWTMAEDKNFTPEEVAGLLETISVAFAAKIETKVA
jgi:hypothetical protein